MRDSDRPTEDHSGHRSADNVVREVHYAALHDELWSPLCHLADGWTVPLARSVEQVTCPCCQDELRSRGHDV